MAESTDEKSEAPSSKRREEAKQDGNLARSTEVNSVMVLLTALLVLRAFIPHMYREFGALFSSTYGLIGTTNISQQELVSIVRGSIITAGRLTLPIAFSILAAGVIANIVQVGFLITGKPLIPKFEKINPLAGFKRLFSMRSLVEMVKNIGKVAIIGWVAYLTFKGEFREMLSLSNYSVAMIAIFLLKVAFKMFLRVGLVLIVLAILDYAYQKFEHEKKLKMTKQELKEERKQMEGDPKVKARVKSLHMEMARRRMMKEVPQATVVVTNPTYIAIAIRYEAGEMDAPLILAKGKRHIAEKIKEIARENKVPVVEDKPLARAMYDKVDVGDSVPVEFFSAVAEILAYVYRLKNSSAA